ncbi:MAG TPA: hypothetical protein VF544_18680 [Pyrinomonadaceae bacterium]|jgi:predicted HicB family RNase H-like nuclease
MKPKSKKPGKVGRRPIPEDERLVVRSYRSTNAEHAAHTKAAEAEGLKVTEWVRKTLNEAVKK